jgi:YVTN family beta-propeller protein
MILNHRYWLAAAALVIAFSSCDFLGADERTGGSYLYVGNWGYDQIYVVDVATNEVVRTLSGFEVGLGGVWKHVATKSGRKLYVDTRGGTYNDAQGKLHVVDVRTWRRRVILDEAAEPFVTANGEVFVLTRDASMSGAAIGRVDTLSDQITFFDTLDVRQNGDGKAVVFDPQRPVLYAVGSSGRLFAYDYKKQAITRTYGTVQDPRSMIVSRSSGKLYVAGGPVVDLERDSVVAWLGGNELGSLALSPSGDTLYVTDPGSRIVGPTTYVSSGKVFLYDTRIDVYVGDVDVSEALPTPGVGKSTADIVLSGGGNTAYVSNQFDLVFVIDLRAGTVSGLIQLEKAHDTRPLSLAPKPGPPLHYN